VDFEFSYLDYKIYAEKGIINLVKPVPDFKMLMVSLLYFMTFNIMFHSISCNTNYSAGLVMLFKTFLYINQKHF